MGHKERPVKEGIPMGLLDLLLVAVGLSMTLSLFRSVKA